MPPYNKAYPDHHQVATGTSPNCDGQRRSTRLSDVSLAANYRRVYGHAGPGGLPVIAAADGDHDSDDRVDVDAARYNTRYRNPSLSHISAERIYILYTSGGLDAVRAQLMRLRAAGFI